MAKKALLMILDGWGIGKHGKGDVIYRKAILKMVKWWLKKEKRET